ncbi:MAG: flavin reductase [Clostridia bacterium]
MLNENIEPTALFKISYGLFLLSCRDGEKDNACIINTASQITDKPKTISIAVNKANYSHDIILKTGIFNISVLTESAEFSLFERFGFQSGKTTSKFDGFTNIKRSANGIYFLTAQTNALISAKVISSSDFGTHTLFVAEVTEAFSISGVPSATYQYYFDNIKPKSKPTTKKSKVYVCKICGYVYEGDPLPDDFVCPICKHGAEDFETIYS